MGSRDRASSQSVCASVPTTKVCSPTLEVLLHCTIAWRASHLWAAYLIERGVPADQALTHARAINLMDDYRMDGGVHPMELFLGRKVSGLGQSR